VKARRALIRARFKKKTRLVSKRLDLSALIGLLWQNSKPSLSYFRELAKLEHCDIIEVAHNVA
jgi:hypothetical protein